jgi:hypothetical protein
MLLPMPEHDSFTGSIVDIKNFLSNTQQALITIKE